MTVYLDIVFLENLIMNLIIILAEAIVLNSLKQFARKLLASGLASFFYIFILFFPKLSFMQIFVSFIIMKVAFNTSSIKALLKRVILFYFISYLFGGLSFAMISIFNDGKITVFDGVLVSDFSLFKLFLCGVLGLLLVMIVLKKRKEHVFKDIEISFNNKTCVVRLLLDTGNLLVEPYTGKPVIIIEKNALKGVLDKDIFDNFHDIIIGRKELPIKMFLIPYKSIGNSSDFLLGFKPTYIRERKCEREYIKDVVIGICEESLSSNNCYSGIFGLDILKEVENYEYS